MSKSLHQILKEEKYNTDKHKFTYIYDKLFLSYKEKEFNLLEIGVSRGGSLRMWRDYFPNAKLVGIDKNPTALRSEERRIEIQLVDQSSREDLENFSKDRNFDIIIDDGSHIMSHQILTFETLWPKLNKEGLYIIEDTETSYWPHSRHGYVDSHPTCMKYFQKMTDQINCKGRDIKPSKMNIYQRTIESITFYRNMIVLKKSS